MVVTTAKRPKPRTHMTADDLAHEGALALVEEQFRDLDVVWAKVAPFPWWPAVVFHSWDAVRAIGLPTEEKKLPLLEPRREPVLDTSGAETSTFRVVRYCLVMFVDQFNFAVVEICPKFIVSYVAYYAKHREAVVNAKPGSKNAKYKKRFNDALAKADGLLHMGMDHTPDDMALLEKPKVEKPVKKRRTDSASQLPPPSPLRDDSLDDGWDDQETDEDYAGAIDGDDDDAFEQQSTARNRRAQKTSDSESSDQTSRRRNGAATKSAKKNGGGRVLLKGKGIVKRPSPAAGVPASKRKSSKKASSYVDDSDEFEAPKSRTNQRKKSQKAAANDPIDLTTTPESATKQRKDSVTSKAKRIKQPAIEVSSEDPSSSSVRGQKKPRGKKKSGAGIEVADLTELADDDDGTQQQSQSSQPVVMTPLSTIWTTKADSDQNSSASSGLAYKQDFVWDASVFTDSDAPVTELLVKNATGEDSKPPGGETSTNGRERALSKRQPRSVQQAQIRQNLMFGNLDPHTMVQCESYRQPSEEENSRSRGPGSLPPPFTVIVHPDATFVCDLHAHLATCEIIGFLGGKWDDATKTLYIQAAFPCRSLMIDGDDGSTDVEMDPGSEIELRGIINDAELEVVGWYHSHPAFAPDPSIRDIENQASYQQLFKRTRTSDLSGKTDVAEPFVGLIVGTYDTRRDTPVSLFRYFHVRGEKVSGGARREIYMPYEFIPARRRYRSVLSDEANETIRRLPVYPSVLKALKLGQRFRPAGSLVSTPSVVEETQIQATRMSPPRRKPVPSGRKRKQSADLGTSEAPAKRGKRERKNRSAGAPDESSQIDLTLDDVEEAAARDDAEDTAATAAVNVIGIAENDPDETEKGGTEVNGGATEAKPSFGDADLPALTKNEDATGTTNCVGGDVVVIQATSSSQDSSTPVGVRDVITKDEAGVDPIDPIDDRARQLSVDPSSPVISDDPHPKEDAAKFDISAIQTPTDAVTERDRPIKAVASASSTSQASSESSPVDTTSGVKLESAQSSGAKRKPAPTVIIDASTEGPAGVSPSSVASNGSGGRRRNRKPAHTSKIPWRSERSPKPDASKNVLDNPQAMATGYFAAFQSLDPIFSRNGPRNDATSTVKDDTENLKEESVQLSRLPKDPEYFFIGDADVKPAKEKEKGVIATTTTATTASIVIASEFGGNCSTDDEIELVAVDEGDRPSEPNLSAMVADAVKIECVPGADEPVSELIQHSEKVVPTPSVDAVIAVDEVALVRACVDQLVEAVVTDTEASNEQDMKVECGQPSLPAGDAVAAAVAVAAAEEVARTEEQKEVCATPVLEILKMQNEAAATNDTVASEGLVSTCVGNSKAAAVLASSARENEKPGDGAAGSGDAVKDENSSNTCTVGPTTDVKMKSVDEEQGGTEPGAELTEQQQTDRVDATPATQTSDNKALLADITSEPGATAQTAGSNCGDVVVKVLKPEPEQAVAEAVPTDKKPLLFGRDRQHEDIRTSLERMEAMMKREWFVGTLTPMATPAASSSQEQVGADTTSDAKPTNSDADATSLTGATENPRAATAERLEAHLTSLRTRYGPGMVGCVEQVVTLVDYYRDFERRIDLSEHWKAKMNKLRKIEASLSEYVQYLNLSVALRRAFVDDLVGYLELSWELTRQGR